MLLDRRSFFGLALTPLAVAQPPRQPNVVVILADDLGYGDLSCYGAPDVRTPHIDALARAGVRFTNFYSNCPVCSPTRAALLSGLYPDRAGVPGVIRTHAANSWGHLSPHATLLPKPLRAVGYHTGIVGKWHLGLSSPNTPLERGFDTFHGFLGDMMDDYRHHRRHGINYLRRNSEPIDPEGHATDLFTAWSIDYVTERQRDGAPFFLYLAYNAPHTPIQPKPEWVERVKQREAGITAKRAAIVALIEHMDDGVGKLVDALKRNGQLERTLIVFTSDNGGELNAGGTAGNLRGGKQDMYEGGIRVPAIAVWPGRIAPASERQDVAISMDLYPTVCAATGTTPPPDIDGREIRWDPGAPPRERDLFWVRREGGPRHEGRDYYAMRRGDWKLLQNSPFEPYQLFNLAADPRETTDLAQREPKRVREMAAALATHIQSAGRVPWQSPQP
ncbi:MAG: sulfatase-like hydrolase/transferase [Bryobacterales bacterium]|nr:sulfatase-like hydrolase/transferase [Bryobacterales bacterium]